MEIHRARVIKNLIHLLFNDINSTKASNQMIFNIVQLKSLFLFRPIRWLMVSAIALMIKEINNNTSKNNTYSYVLRIFD